MAGVTWSTSYEGRWRGGADASQRESHWEYVLRLDGSGQPDQATGPDRTWRYKVTYTIQASACPGGS
jgi:hypothetical protein